MEDNKELEKTIDITEEEKAQREAEEQAMAEQKRVMDAKMDAFIRERIYVYLAKNNDYGDSFNKSLDAYGSVAFQVRANDKILRVKSLATKKQLVADEKTEDSVMDLFNYVAMFGAYQMQRTELIYIINYMYQLLSNNLSEFFKVLTEQNLINPNNEADKPVMALLGNTIAKKIMG